MQTNEPTLAEREIARWTAILDRNPNNRQRLASYVASLYLGREFSESGEDFMVRRGLTEFAEWAKAAVRG